MEEVAKLARDKTSQGCPPRDSGRWRFFDVYQSASWEAWWRLGIKPIAGGRACTGLWAVWAQRKQRVNGLTLGLRRGHPGLGLRRAIPESAQEPTTHDVADLSAELSTQID